jgi:hypothetical protein
LEADFGTRLNLVTGDNGLGKTFLLDAAWYALTSTWANGEKFYPLSNARKTDRPSIDYTVVAESGKKAKRHAAFHFPTQSWRHIPDPCPICSLVVYARIDGGFSVWDPARNAAPERVDSDRASAYQFSKKEIWDGLEERADGQRRTICNGLLRDVETWRLKGNGIFQLLQDVLNRLSLGEGETLSIGESVRVRLDDTREIPTLQMRYGVVPVTHAAAGMRRVMALAYILVWAWEEHRRAAELRKEHPTNRVVLLFDEVEAHLHPKWQRVFLPSLLAVVETLLLDKGTQSVQIVATTHAPLVLASVETLWKEESDKLFILDIKKHAPQPTGIVTLTETPWAAQGDAVGWLVSGAFGLKQARSKDAEIAIEAAEKWMRGEHDTLPANLRSKEAIHDELRRVLPGHDPFWPRWIVKTETQA